MNVSGWSRHLLLLVCERSHKASQGQVPWRRWDVDGVTRGSWAVLGRPGLTGP